MPHSHYVLDLYFGDGTQRGPRQHEAMRLVADDDSTAIAEGKRIDSWKRSNSFQIRAITSSARSGDRVIFVSTPQENVESAPVIELSNLAAVDLPLR